ncbi:MAG TPA: hypothetical protein VK578_17795 [Edaphobacter sp.]|nr:hypothetical protein [Edaphobacter sp.]
MKAIKGMLLACIIALPFLTTQSAFAKDAKPTNDKELNIQAYEKLLRVDVSSKREAIVKEIMQLSDSDAQKFWPIYRDYVKEQAKLDATEAQLTNEYVSAYQNISDSKADELLSKSFELEEQRAELKKKYFGTMKKALSASTAAKFFEVDSQMQHIHDLQISSQLPANQ